MLTINKVLAVTCGLATTAAATMAGLWANQYRKVYDEFNATLPHVTQSLVSVPVPAYVGIGLLLGTVVAGVMLAISPKWLSIAVACAVAAILAVLIVALACIDGSDGASNKRSIGLLSGFVGEQRNAADSR
jgi:ABC-type molybdate transport system substrate-binding protein